MQLHPSPSTSQDQEEGSLPDRRAPRTQRIGALLQSLVAVLLITVLVAGFLFLIAARRGGLGGFIPQVPAIAQTPGRVVALSGDGVISTLDARTGKILWSYETHQQVINEEVGLVVHDQVVYSLINGQVYVLRVKDGSPLWHFDVHLTPPTYYAFNERLLVDQGVVFVGEISGQIKDLHGAVYALRASDGKFLWKYASTVYSLLAAKNGIAYVRALDDKSSTWKLQALRATDGNVLWSINVEANSAVVANNTVYALSVESSHRVQVSLKAIKHGSVLWSKSISANPLEDRPYLSQAELIAGGNGQFCAYRMSDGTQEWCTHQANSGTSGAPPAGLPYPDAVIANDELYSVAGSSSGLEIASYQLKNGNLRWSRQFSNVDARTVPSFPRPVVTSNVVAASFGGKVITLRSSDGHELWQTELPDVQILATES